MQCDFLSGILCFILASALRVRFALRKDHIFSNLAMWLVIYRATILLTYSNAYMMVDGGFTEMLRRRATTQLLLLGHKIRAGPGALLSVFALLYASYALVRIVSARIAQVTPAACPQALTPPPPHPHYAAADGSAGRGAREPRPQRYAHKRIRPARTHRTHTARAHTHTTHTLTRSRTHIYAHTHMHTRARPHAHTHAHHTSRTHRHTTHMPHTSRTLAWIPSLHPAPYEGDSGSLPRSSF